MLKRKILERLFRQHYNEMFHLARTLLSADDEAEDIVLDVFARLMESDIVPEAKGIRAYLMTAVHHGCTNIIRRNTMQQKVEKLYPIDNVTDLQPIDRITERLDAIQACVNEFREPHRSIFYLRLDEPFVTVNSVTGDIGMKQALDEYCKLIRNKTPKSRR